MGRRQRGGSGRSSLQDAASRRAFLKICITNQFFNGTAKTHADLNSVKLLDQTQLAELLKEFPVTMLDVEKLVFSEWGGRV